MSKALHELVVKQYQELNGDMQELKALEKELTSLVIDPTQNLDAIQERIKQEIQNKPRLAPRLSIISQELNDNYQTAIVPFFRNQTITNRENTPPYIQKILNQFKSGQQVPQDTTNPAKNLSVAINKPTEKAEKLNAVQKNALKKIDDAQKNSLNDSEQIIKNLKEQQRRLKVNSQGNTNNKKNNNEEIEFIGAYIEVLEQNKGTLKTISNSILEGKYNKASQLIGTKQPQGQRSYDTKLREVYEYRSNSIASIQEQESNIINNAWAKDIDMLIPLVEQSESDAKTELAKQRITSLKEDIVKNTKSKNKQKAINNLFEKYRKANLIELQSDFEQKIQSIATKESFLYKILENIHKKASEFISIMDLAKDKNSKEVIEIYQEQLTDNNIDPIFKQFLNNQIKYINDLPRKLEINYKAFQTPNRRVALYKTKVTSIEKIRPNLKDTCTDLIDKLKKIEQELKDPNNPNIEDYENLQKLVFNSQEISKEIKNRKEKLSKLIKDVAKANAPAATASKDIKVQYAKLIANAYKAATDKLELAVDKKYLFTSVTNSYEQLKKDMEDFEEALSQNFISEMDQETHSFYKGQFDTESFKETLETLATQVSNICKGSEASINAALRQQLEEKLKKVNKLIIDSNYQEAYELLEPYYLYSDIPDEELRNGMTNMFTLICAFLGKEVPSKSEQTDEETDKKTDEETTKIEPKPPFNPTNYTSKAGFMIMPSNVAQINKAVIEIGKKLNQVKKNSYTAGDKNKKIKEYEEELLDLKKLIQQATRQYNDIFENATVTFEEQNMTAKRAYGQVLVAITAYIPTSTTRIKKDKDEATQTDQSPPNFSQTGRLNMSNFTFKPGFRSDQEGETPKEHKKQIPKDNQPTKIETEIQPENNGNGEDKSFNKQSLVARSTGGQSTEKIQQSGNLAILNGIRLRKNRKQLEEIRTDYLSKKHKFGYDLEGLEKDIEAALVTYQDKVRAKDAGTFSGDLSGINTAEVKKFEILIKECDYILKNHAKHNSFLGKMAFSKESKINALIVRFETYRNGLNALKMVFEEYLNGGSEDSQGTADKNNDSRLKTLKQFKANISNNKKEPESSPTGFNITDLIRAQQEEK